MTKAEQREFIKTFCDTMRDAALSKVDQMPDNWDGHELRSYLSEKFAFEITGQMQNKRDKRVKDFYNTIATTTL